MQRECIRQLCFVLLFCQIALVNANEQECVISTRIESSQQSRAAGSHSTTILYMQSYSLLQRLIERAGCTMQPQQLPAGRAIKLLEEGDLSVMVGMSKTPEREQFALFIGPHHIERMVVVAQRQLANRITSLEQLLAVDGLISVTEGGYYGPRWQQLVDAVPQLTKRLFYASGNQQKMAMLASGRVIAALEDESVVDEMLQQPELAAHYTKLFLVHENPVYFAFSRKSVSAELQQILATQWQLMQLKGAVDTISQQLNTL